MQVHICKLETIYYDKPKMYSAKGKEALIIHWVMPTVHPTKLHTDDKETQTKLNLIRVDNETHTPEHNDEIKWITLTTDKECEN